MAPNDPRNSMTYYIDNNDECHKMGEFNSYVCDISDTTYNGYLKQVKESFEVEL